jgi:hypothetical protein
MTTSTLQPSLAPSTSPRKTAAVAGALYLVTFVSSIPAVALIGPVLSDPEYVIGPGSDTQVLWGSLLDLVNALACVGTAVVLFPSSAEFTKPPLSVLSPHGCSRRQSSWWG